MFYKLNTRFYTQDVKSGVFHQEAKRKGLNLLEFGLSRIFVGIIFYTREVLLTSHYEERLFDHASQPRVAGTDIRLLSHFRS